MIALAIFCPPLYFMLEKKWGLFILTSAMAVIAFFFAVTVVLLPGTFILWVIAMFPAVMDYKRQQISRQMKQHAEMIGQEIAAKMSRNEKT